MNKANKKSSQKRHTVRNILLWLLVAFLIYILIGLLPGIDVSKYKYESNKVPEAFDGFKILQISDLHCKEFGTDQAKLLKKIEAQKPDIIVLSGDMIDGYHDSIEPSVTFLMKLSKLEIPVFFVNGNHETDKSGFKKKFDEACEKYGVNVINDMKIELTRENETINLYGFDWCVPAKYADMPTENKKFVLPFEMPDTSALNILINHNASVFPYIADIGFDLILAGHLHGGIIRLPFIGGLVNNNHSFGCKYEAGYDTIGTSTQITSRGMGDAIIAVPRFYNRPEIVVVTLKYAEN